MPLLEFDRWYPDQIAYAEFIVGFAAFFINPNFTLADESVYPRFRYIFKGFKQEVVQPLINLCCTDFYEAYVRFLRGIDIQMMAAQVKCVIF